MTGTLFGGFAFWPGGHIFAGVLGDELMVRLGREAAGRAPERDHVRDMDVSGCPVTTMIFVQLPGLDGTAPGQWIIASAGRGRNLPPKPPRPAARRPGPDPPARHATRAGRI
jgi:hypothetical protein